MRRGATWLVVLVATTALSVAVRAAPVDPSGTRSFEGWTATCNNLGACVVIGTAPDDLFYVRMARAAGAEAAAKAKLVLAAQEPQKGAAPAFRLLAVDGDARKALGPFPAKAAPDDASILSASIAPGEPSLAFIDAIRNAASLDYAVLAAKGTLDLKGLSAALRWIDERQGRQGTPSALVARGMTPLGQVPPAPRPPVVAAAPAGSVVAVEKPVAGKALLAMAAKACDPDVVKAQESTEAWRLGDGRMLVTVSCTQGAYNFASALYFTDTGGGDPRPVALPRAPGDTPDAANIVVNMEFDPRTMELSGLDKGRGLGDCGVAATWLWTGHDFALLDASGLEACPGALPEDWPSLYQAERKRG